MHRVVNGWPWMTGQAGSLIDAPTFSSCQDWLRMDVAKESPLRSRSIFINGWMRSCGSNGSRCRRCEALPCRRNRHGPISAFVDYDACWSRCTLVAIHPLMARALSCNAFPSQPECIATVFFVVEEFRPPIPSTALMQHNAGKFLGSRSATLAIRSDSS